MRSVEWHAGGVYVLITFCTNTNDSWFW